MLRQCVDPWANMQASHLVGLRGLADPEACMATLMMNAFRTRLGGGCCGTGVGLRRPWPTLGATIPPPSWWLRPPLECACPLVGSFCVGAPRPAGWAGFGGSPARRAEPSLHGPILVALESTSVRADQTLGPALLHTSPPSFILVSSIGACSCTHFAMFVRMPLSTKSVASPRTLWQCMQEGSRSGRGSIGRSPVLCLHVACQQQPDDSNWGWWVAVREHVLIVTQVELVMVDRAPPPPRRVIMAGSTQVHRVIIEHRRHVRLSSGKHGGDMGHFEGEDRERRRVRRGP